MLETNASIQTVESPLQLRHGFCFTVVIQELFIEGTLCASHFSWYLDIAMNKTDTSIYS